MKSATKKNAKRFGAYCCDENGVAVRCFDNKRACWSWMDKHHPELSQEEKGKRIWTFSSHSQLLRFWNKQIRLGCSDSDVLGCMAYWCGCGTKQGLNLKNGKAYKIVSDQSLESLI